WEQSATIRRLLFTEIDHRISLNADQAASALVATLEKNAKVWGITDGRWPIYLPALHTALELPLPVFGQEKAQSCRSIASPKSKVGSLLVGINDAPGGITGPTNDVALIKGSLLAQGIQDDQIRFLDRVSKRADVLAALADLANKVGCGDFVFFHWSSVSLSPEGEGKQAIAELPPGWATFLPAAEDVTTFAQNKNQFEV